MLNQLRRNELLITLCIQVTLTTMGMGIVSPILPQYAQYFGVNITMVGLIITVLGVARLIADIPAGRLSTALGCRPVLIAGPIILCLGSIGCGLSVNYGMLLAFRFVQGIGSAVVTTTSMIAIVQISTSQNRGQVMGFYQGCFLIGGGIGPTVGGFIAEYMGLRAPFYFYAGLAAMAAVWNYYRLPRDLMTMKPEEAVHSAETSGASVGVPVVPKVGIKPLLASINFLLICSITFGIFFMRNASQSQILPLIGSIRLNLSEGQIGLAMTLITVANASTLFLCSKLSDKFGRKVVILAGCVVVSLSLIILAFSTNYFLLILSCLLGGFGVGIAGPAPAAYVADIVPKENYGSGMGLYRAVGDLGMVIGPILLGWMSDVWDFNTALFFNCIFLIITAVSFQIFASEVTVKRNISLPTPE